MRLYRSTFTFLAFLALSVSCNKQDEEAKPSENCRFVGRSYHWERKDIFHTSVDTYESNFKQDDQGRLTLVTVSKTGMMKDSTGVFANTTDEETYEFIYDAAGFLTELKQHGLQLQQGSAKYKFNYSTFNYRKGRIETTRVTTYTYSEGRVQSSKYVSNIVVQGDNLPVATFPDSYTTLYKYDSKGIIQTISSGGIGTNYVNGIRASNVSGDGKNVIKYDDQGRIISYSSPNDQRIFKYDERGNQILQEGFEGIERRFSEESKFDDHLNPDNLIPAHYKGIPEPMKIGYFSDNPNNWVEIKYTYRNEVPSIQSNVWTYHPNGLPATSTLITGTDDNKSTWITKFNYENCE